MTTPFALTLLAVLLLTILLARFGLRKLSSRNALSSVLGSLMQFVLGFATLVLVTYVVIYFLALVGGFYESLTCKVVTLPACEDPLALPAWLRLPQQSVGGVIGILPLLGIYLAKVLQSKGAKEKTSSLNWRENFWPRAFSWIGSNAGLMAVFFIELWLAYLRGSAEAADRQVRIALGLDQELPAIYLSVAQWGAVVLALGLSVVVVYLGVIGQYARLLLVRSLASLEYGATLITPLIALLHMLAEGLVDLWKAISIALGRLLLKLQSLLYRFWTIAVVALGRFLLKLQSLVYRLWVAVASTIGWLLLSLRALFSWRRRGGLEIITGLLLLGATSYSYAATYVVLFDATGSEKGRLEETSSQVLAWADPSPERALLSRGDRLILIPIRAPGNLDTTYSALFNATYPSSQLDRYAFFSELRQALPKDVDTDPGTGLSDSLRAAITYLEEAPDERVLIVYGNGEDHAPDPVTAAELAQALQNATVIHLNLGLEERERWKTLYTEAGANKLLLYDLAATRSLRGLELKQALQED